MEETIEICYMNYIEKCLDSDHSKEYGFFATSPLRIKGMMLKETFRHD